MEPTSRNGVRLRVAAKGDPCHRRRDAAHRIARALGEQEAVGLLSETLEEEKQTDLKLTEVTEQYIMAAALEGGSGETAKRGSQTRSKAS